MVDVASPRTMPSENEVHVARSFLTKILRNSMRKNDPDLRPHSWHSSKLTEEESEPAGSEATPAPVWQPKHEARPKDSTTEGAQKTQQTSQLSSVNSMERLERPSHPYPPGCLSPPKYIDSAEPFSGSGAKRDSAFSCFSGSSSPPVLDSSSSSRKGTSAENIFFKGVQSEEPQQNERHRYVQTTHGNGGWQGPRGEDLPASRVSIAGRPSAGSVWQVPEKKKSQSPPPPLPPLRSDSFTATKVFPYSEGPLGPPTSRASSFEKPTENQQNCLTFQNQLHPNKLFSLSSIDVSQPHYAQSPAHQRQYSDESPFYLQTGTAPQAKTQSVGSYYRSLQDLPTNIFSRKHVRHSTAAMTGCGGISSLVSGGHNRHSSPVRNNQVKTGEVRARQSKAGDWRGETENSQWRNSGEPGLQSSLKANIKTKYPTAQSQMPHSENKDRNGNGLNYDYKPNELSPQSTEEPSMRATDEMKRLFLTHQSNDHKFGLSRQQDPWVPQEDHRISARKTPLLHFLAQESQTLAERQQTAAKKSVTSTQEVCDTTTTGSGKASRRSDRYATTLRKEIQQKRAQLQKSRSAATLTYEAEEEDAEEWRSMEASPSSNTYIDHLKEAQARVLQATSFQRRDLEPLGPEAPVLKASYGRIRGRRRFHPAKRTHSFSEPDKIDKVGVDGESQHVSEQQEEFFETKPAFPRPVLKSGHGTNLNLDKDETAKPQETSQSKKSDQSEPLSHPNEKSPGHKQVLLEQQRLGTFAEYQATWNKQKKAPDAKTQGRYHSAENILDATAEEKALCIHERSRSSPSADFYKQKISSHWRDPQTQEISSTTREATGSRSPDHSPQLVPSAPRSDGTFPGPPDHRTKPSLSLPSGRRSISPNSESRRPQTQSLLPPPRLHLGPETTTSSQEFLGGAQPEPAGLQPPSNSSPSSPNHAAARPPSAGPTQTVSPHLSALSGPGAAESEEEDQTAAPSPSPSAALSLPGSDRARSPSPQFAPLRLTDEPPAVSLQDESQLRSETEPQIPAEMDVRSPVRKVPIRIVHAESSSDRPGQAYLPQSGESCSVPTPPTSLSSLTAERPASSLFSAYTRPDPKEPGPDPASSQESCGAQNLEEEAKREELARDIMGRDKSLVDVLDQSGRKTTMDLMEGLFPPEEKILEGVQLRRRASAGSRLPTTSRREEEDVSVSASASLVPSSSYYNTSAPKAELLIKMKDMQEQLDEQDSEDELDVDLAGKKQELITSLARKLEVLREARQSLQEDVEDNETLGREVEATVQRLCQPNQLDRFRMFVGDLDKVVSLLLSLSGRLARVENALNSLEDEAPPEEKRTLTEKRKLLMRQHDDAKELKENLDRRERLVSGIMEAHLDAESLDDYRHFVKMKSALIIEQRKLEDKIKLGEEQLKCLTESLPLDQRPPLAL